jgi:hypothetical protein
VRAFDAQHVQLASDIVEGEIVSSQMTGALQRYR